MSHSANSGVRYPPKLAVTSSAKNAPAPRAFLVCGCPASVFRLYVIRFASERFRVDHIFTSSLRDLQLPPPVVPCASDDVGVPQNEYSLSPVRRILTASWNKERNRLVVEIFQVNKHIVENSADDSRHILSNDPSGPEETNNLAHLRPEVTVICCASSLPGDTVRLTWESAADNVNWIEVVGSAFSDVIESLHVGPVLGEYLLAERVNFHLPLALHPGPLESQVKPANAGKQAAEG